MKPRSRCTMHSDQFFEDLVLKRVEQEKEIKLDAIFDIFREYGSGDRHARVLIQRLIEAGRLSYDRHRCLTLGPEHAATLVPENLP